MIEKYGIIVIDKTTDKNSLNSVINILKNNNYKIVIKGENSKNFKEALFEGFEEVYKNTENENLQIYFIRLYNLKVINSRKLEEQIISLETNCKKFLFPFQSRKVRDYTYLPIEFYLKSRSLLEKIILSKNLINDDKIDEDFQKIVNRIGIKIDFISSYKDITDVIKIKKKNHPLYNYILRNVIINIYKGLNDVLIDEYNQPFRYIDKDFIPFNNINQEIDLKSNINKETLKSNDNDNSKIVEFDNNRQIEEYYYKYQTFINSFESNIITYLKLKNKRNISISIFLTYTDKINDKTLKSIKFQEKIINLEFYPIKNVEEIKNINVNTEYVLFMDNNDLISPFFGIYIPEEMYDFVYFNEDVLENNIRTIPFFKVDFSPNTILSFNYIKNGFLISKKVFNEIKESINKLDFQLLKQPLIAKSLIKSNNVCFIDEILYHTDITNFEKYINFVEDKDYLFNFLSLLSEKQTGFKIKHFEEVISNRIFNTRYGISNDVKVSIIIPTINLDLIKTSTSSIINKSSYKNYEIIVINNNPKDIELSKYLSELKSNYSFVKVIDYLDEFNQSKMNNIATEIAEGDYYIFLNDDIKVITEDQIERLIEKAQLKNVATVGGLLYFENDLIQHAGIIIGKKYLPQHIYYNEPKIYYDYFPFIPVYAERNVLGNTGACLCISKEKFKEIGGFNINLKNTGNDVEFNIRCINNKYFNLFDPNIELYHLESVSRKKLSNDDADTSIFNYSELLLKGDKQYNLNYDIIREL